MRLFGYLVVLAALVVAILALPLCAAVKVGDKAPDFILPTVDGKAQFRLSELGGKPILLMFWMSTCPHCYAEAPVVQKVYRELTGKGLYVVGIAVDANRSAISEFVSRNKLTFPNVFAGSDKGIDVVASYGLSRVPVLVLIGKDARVKAIWSGTTDEKTIRAGLAQVGIK